MKKKTARLGRFLEGLRLPPPVSWINFLLSRKQRDVQNTDFYFRFPEFIVGVLQQLPVPVGLSEQSGELARTAHLSIAKKRNLDRGDETSHVFHLPALLQVPGDTPDEHIAA